MAHDPVRYEDRMSDGDALMWNIERDPLLRSTIAVVWLMDRTPDRERLERKVERATRTLPRLRQRVLPNPLALAPPRWQVDPYFDLTAHLSLAQGAGRRLAARAARLRAADGDAPLRPRAPALGAGGGGETSRAAAVRSC